jgi:hypothetical protein
MITKEQISATKAANPGAELSIFTNQEFDIEWLIRTPSDVEYQGWRAQQSASGDDVLPINREFVIRAVAIPDGVKDPAIRQKLEKHTGLVESLTRALIKLAGGRAEFTVKKV